jgi:hypothetical protein
LYCSKDSKEIYPCAACKAVAIDQTPISTKPNQTPTQSVFFQKMKRQKHGKTQNGNKGINFLSFVS